MTCQLSEELRDASNILDLFYLNKFDEAFAKCDEKCETSILHSHAKTFLTFFYSLLTLEPAEIVKGKEAIERTLEFCQRTRRPHSIIDNLSSFIWKTDVNKFTDSEVHAELIYAECQIMLGLLTFFGDQNIISLIKGGIRMTTANQCFKFCNTILNERKTWNSENVKMQFESGVCNGLGIFNLCLSMLPRKVLKVLEIAGFSGDKDVALTMLKRCTQLKDGVRYRAAVIVLQAFALYFEQLMGFSDIDCDWVQSLTDELQAKFPKGVFVLFFAAKFNLMRGMPDKAIKQYIECIRIQDSWKQIHSICHWDLIWCYALQQKWANAAEHAKALRNECSFSPATNEYQFAVCKLMQIIDDDKQRNCRQEALAAMKTVPQLKVRYAGKCLPQEKFICIRATQFMEEERDPLLAIVELMYIWNVFSMTNNCVDLVSPLLQRVNKKLRELKKNNNTVYDSIACLLLVKGVLSRNLNNLEEAMSCFKSIIESEKKITRDNYIAPHATLELAVTYLRTGEYEECKKWLRKTKHDYGKFLNESVVSLRVAAAFRKMKQMGCVDVKC